MPMIYLVRHGRAAANWDADADPGLDPLGHEQAHHMATTMAGRGKMDFLVSPMRRTRETAVPLAEIWNVTPSIEPRVSEIPSPTSNLQARGQWLREIAARRWRELDPSLQGWRAQLLDTLRALTRDTVIVTHYIAINVAAGAAVGDDRVVYFRPDYCSITILRNESDALQLVERGTEATTKIL